jgi:hypothetical protein
MGKCKRKLVDVFTEASGNIIGTAIFCDKISGYAIGRLANVIQFAHCYQTKHSSLRMSYK